MSVALVIFLTQSQMSTTFCFMTFDVRAIGNEYRVISWLALFQFLLT